MMSATIANYLKLDQNLISKVQHLSELPLVISSCEGVYLYDVDGKKYVDMVSAVCTQNLGYITMPKLHFANFSFPYASSLNQLELAKRLVKLMPYKAKISYGVAGSEANDAAIKYCRASTGRSIIISFEGDYHGTSYGAATITTMPGRMSNHIAPMLPDCYALKFCSKDASDNEVDEVLERLDKIGYQNIAGFILEAYQGDMGLVPIHERLLRTIYENCQKYGARLVFDEVQLAFFRTGNFFSYQNYQNIVPDLVTMGKNIGGGLPLSCVIGRDFIMDSLNPAEHDFSMAGHSEACARGIYNFDEILKLKEKGSLDELAEYFKQKIDELLLKYPQVVYKKTGDYLAYGLWLKSPYEFLSDNEACFRVLFDAFKHGVYTQRLGSHFLRLEPPYTITKDQLDFAFKQFENAIQKLLNQDFDDEALEYFGG